MLGFNIMCGEKCITFLIMIMLFTWLVLVWYTDKLSSSYYEVCGPFTVIDGDTVSIGPAKYRFKYIDAMEIHGFKDKQILYVGNLSCIFKYGNIARDYLENISSDICLKCDGSTDRYGRFICSAFFENESDESVELDMVERGLAMCYYREGDIFDPFKWKCLNAEHISRADKRGLWSCSID